MKRLLFVLLLITSSAFGSTSSLLNFDGNYTDTAGVTWTPTGSYSRPSSAAYLGTGGLRDTVVMNSTSGNLTPANVSGFTFGTGDYTMEYYYRVNSTTHTAESFFPSFFNLTINASNYLTFYPQITTTANDGYSIRMIVDAWSGGVNTGSLISTSVAIDYNRWLHICAERRSGVLYLYINGRQVGTTSNAAAIYDLTSISSVSLSRSAQVKSFVGTFDMDEFRVTKNGYVYGGEFAPLPVEEYPASATSYLPFTDDSLHDPLGNTWSGTASYAWGKNGRSLVYAAPAVSASNNLIVTSSATPFSPGWGDYTLEFWVGLNTQMIQNSSSQRIVALVLSGGGSTWEHTLFFSTMDAENQRYGLQCKLWGTGINASVFAPSLYSINAGVTRWHHICMERQSTNLNVYFDGVYAGTEYVAVTMTPTYVGFSTNATPNASSTIYVDDFIFSKGIAKYKGSNFTPYMGFEPKGDAISFAPIYYNTSVMPDAYTKNLLHFDGNYNDISGDNWIASGAWYVAASGNNMWTTASSAAKFGSHGIYDACSSHLNWGVLKADNPSKFWYGTGDYTIEWWQRISSITNTGGTTNMMDFFAVQNISNYFQLYSRYSVNSLSAYSVTMGAAVLSGGVWQDVRQSLGVAVNVGDWVHCAASRVSGTLKLFINGTNVLNITSAAGTYNFNSISAQEVSMQRVYNPASTLTCVMNFDEFRAANYGIYTSNFTPPTSAYGLTTNNRFNYSDILRLTTRLPDDDTVSLFHYNNLGDEDTDLGAATWTVTRDAYAPMTTTVDGKANFGRALYDSADVSPDSWWLTTTATATLNAIGTGDFSLEFWFRPVNVAIDQNSSFSGFFVEAIGLPAGQYRFMQLYYAHPTGFAPGWGLNPNHGGDMLAIPLQLIDGNWYHICVERYNGTVTVYLNGVAQDSSTGLLATADLGLVTSWRIGRDASGGLGVSGSWRIDELKLSKRAVYMGNFTPPTTQHYYLGTNKLGFN